MNDTAQKRKITPKERFRERCPELYEKLLADRIRELPHDKQSLFFRLAMRYNEQHLYV